MGDPETLIFRVLPRQVETTLAAALRQWLPDRSWSQVRGLLRSRRVMLSGNLCVDPGRRLRLSDVVKILAQPAAPPPRPQDVRVRYLDAHVVVVEKPAGMTSTRHAEERHWPARRKQLQPTLDELLPPIVAQRERRGASSSREASAKGRRESSRLASRKRRGPLPRVRAVHRLDRDTSGLMVFARTREAEQHLMQQFRRHTTERRYVAIVCGTVAAQTIESRLVRDRGDGRRGSTTLPDVGKLAVTHVRPIERLGEYTLVECRLETGRTHQIRIHLAEQGHPVCGEKLYQPARSGRAGADSSGAPRIALHAAELGFEHPISGKRLRFKTPLPADLAEFLKRLRRDAGA